MMLTLIKTLLSETDTRTWCTKKMKINLNPSPKNPSSLHPDSLKNKTSLNPDLNLDQRKNLRKKEPLTISLTSNSKTPLPVLRMPWMPYSDIKTKFSHF